MKFVFLKAPARVSVLRSIAGEIPLPPEPILTRWSTWLRAVAYYRQHFDTIKEVIENLVNDAQCVDTLQKLVREHGRHIATDIAFVDMNYGFITQKISIFETQTILLSDSIAHLNETIDKIDSVRCNIGMKISEHFEGILGRNPNLNEFRIINDIISNSASRSSLPVKLENIGFYRLCNMTSVDTERCFSRYKSLVDGRRHFKFDNLCKYFFLNCNAFFDE